MNPSQKLPSAGWQRSGYGGVHWAVATGVVEITVATTKGSSRKKWFLKEGNNKKSFLYL